MFRGMQHCETLGKQEQLTKKKPVRTWQTKL